MTAPVIVTLLFETQKQTLPAAAVELKELLRATG